MSKTTNQIVEALKVASRVPAASSIPNPRAGVPPYGNNCARPGTLEVPTLYRTVSAAELGRQTDTEFNRQRFGNMTGWLDMTLRAKERSRLHQGEPPGKRLYGMAPSPYEWLAEQQKVTKQQQETGQQQELNTSRSVSLPPSARPVDNAGPLMSRSPAATRRNPRVPEIVGMREAVHGPNSLPAQGQYSATQGMFSASSAASSQPRGGFGDPTKTNPQNAAWILRAQQALKGNAKCAPAGALRATGGGNALAGFAGSWSGWQYGGPGMHEWGAAVAGPGRSHWEP